ncbi:MAG: hypothetical protein RI885_711 [Actinomycetota bacterium]
MVRFTAARQDFTFTDAEGVVIHYHLWKAGSPRGVVQIAHGLGEYAARYELLAQDLVNAGFSVYADDHRGHGQTGVEQHDGDLSKLGTLGPGGLRATLESVRGLSRIVRAENPRIPLVLFGHSWGSVLAQKIVDTHPDEYDAFILSGTAYRTPLHMRGTDLNRAHKHLGTTGYEWLSRDETVSAAFRDDALTFEANSLKVFSPVDIARQFGRPRRDFAHDIPLLIQVGSDDTVGGTRSAELLAAAYIRRSKLTDVELIVYTDARHEILNEINQAEVRADLLAWLDSRMPPRA